MNRRTLILLVALLLFLIAAAATRGFGLFGNRDDGPLTLYGNVDIREVDMAFRLPGRVTAIPVEEGQKVRAGALLAALDAAPVQDRLDAAAASAAQAEALLDKARNGSRAQEVAQGRAALVAAQAARDAAAAEYKRRQSLVEEGAVSRALWDQTVATLRQSEAQLAQAKQSLSLLEEGARKEDVAAARAQLAAAQAQRAAAGTDLRDTRLIAPSDGTIVTRAMEPGAMAAAGQTVVTIALARPMRVRAYVSEASLSRISPGMKVQVRIDGNDRAYDGSIGYISPRAEFTPKSVETEELRADLVYRLRIIVANPDDALRQGQPVTISVPDARPARR